MFWGWPCFTKPNIPTFPFKVKRLPTRDTYLVLDSFTLFYTANCIVTVAVTYLELDNVTSKLDTNFLWTSSKSVN